MQLLTCANQVGKSFALQRKMIWLATSPHLWPRYFPKRGAETNCFLWFSPDKNTFKREWNLKWETSLPKIPRDHPLWEVFGYELGPKKDGVHEYIRWNSGVYTYFMFYTQDPSHLQSSTVDAVFCDEEPPESLYNEIRARLIATRGFFCAAFTATIGQLIWYNAMEKVGTKDENFVQAWKRCISLYECQKYMDGDTNTPWDDDSIQSVIDDFSHDPDELKKRVWGRFVLGSGKAFFGYLPSKSYLDEYSIQRGCPIFGVADPGSGGEKGHPAGLMIVQHDIVRNWLVVLSCWRGDKVATTSNDILKQFSKMSQGLQIEALIYDHSAADFRLTCERDRSTLQLLSANKGRKEGFERVNSYLEAGVLKIPQNRPDGVTWWEKEQIEKLHDELVTVVKVPETGGKRPNITDDLTDCLRYVSLHIHIPVEMGKDGGAVGNARYKLVKVGREKFFAHELEQDIGAVSDEYQKWLNVYDSYG